VFVFADYEFDLRRHELRKEGRRVPLQEQPYQILACLLERPGEIVSREALRDRLWPSGTYVEFEKSINVAVMKLRDALGDSAGGPRFVETVPRLGYRFVGEVEDRTVTARTAAPDALADPSPGGAPAAEGLRPPGALTVESSTTAQAASRRARRRRVGVSLGIAALVAAAVLALVMWRARNAASPPSVRSLAVLPFVDQSPQPGEQYLAAGLTEELITRLAQIGTLKVTSRTSSEALRGSPDTVPVLARRLGVDAVVEGSVARFGSRIRISAQLVDGASDRHLWARRYEEDERDLLSLQNAIARDIAREIAATLRPDEERRLARRQTGDPEAYREYLKGRYLLARRSTDGFLGAIRHFRRSIALDDQLALGHLGLAITFEGMDSLGVLEGAAERVRGAAERALELDPDLAEAHAALGAALDSEGRPAEAAAAFRRAIDCRRAALTRTSGTVMC
jgi:TolB-like protein/DNA-binding winged helix-turn-helix (wHTH) protein